MCSLLLSRQYRNYQVSIIINLNCIFLFLINLDTVRLIFVLFSKGCLNARELYNDFNFQMANKRLKVKYESLYLFWAVLQEVWFFSSWIKYGRNSILYDTIDVINSLFMKCVWHTVQNMKLRLWFWAYIQSLIL